MSDQRGRAAAKPARRTWWRWFLAAIVCLIAPTLPLQLWAMGTGGVLILLLFAFSVVAGLWSVMGYALAWSVFLVVGRFRPRWRWGLGPVLFLLSLLFVAVPLQDFSRWVGKAERSDDTRDLGSTYVLGLPMAHGGAALGYPEVAMEVLGLYVPYGGTVPVVSAFPLRSKLVRDAVLRGGGKVTWPNDVPFAFMLSRWSTRAGLALHGIDISTPASGLGVDHHAGDVEIRFRGGPMELVPAKSMSWLPLADPDIGLRMSEDPLVRLQREGWWTPYTVRWHWLQRSPTGFSVVESTSTWPFAVAGLVVPLCGLVALGCSLFVLVGMASRAPLRALRCSFDPLSALRCARKDHPRIALLWISSMMIVVVWELLARGLLFAACLLG